LGGFGVAIVEETLSDNSKQYDVRIQDQQGKPVTFTCDSLPHAEEIARALKNVVLETEWYCHF
jgi:hypothetical protein